ncbi:MAG: CsbD family protein [Myxococcales bacterium]
MNWTQIEGKWDQVKGQLRSQWGKLTDDDVANLRGKKDQLVGKIQERYGVAKDEAEQQIDTWLKKFNARDPS